MNLNESVLKVFCEDVAKKSVKAVNEPTLVKEFLKYIQMNNQFMSTTSAYEIASTMRSYSTWYDNKDIEPNNKYGEQREVYYIDLGAFNLKYEEGYVHPCVIIKRYGTNVLVIPGSTKSYGKSNDLIFDIDAGNGFKENTGLMLDQIRCVSTTRFVSKLEYGKVSPEVFNDVLDRVMKKLFSGKFHEYTQFKLRNEKLQKQLEREKENYNKLKEENEKLKEELKIYKDVTKIERDA